MTATHGLSGRMGAIHAELQARRRPTGRRAPENVTLREWLAERSLTPGHVYSEIGLDPRRDSLEAFLDHEDGRFLFVELARDAVLRGMSAKLTVVSQAGAGNFVAPDTYAEPTLRGVSEAAFYRDLIAREISVPTPSHIMPWRNLPTTTMRETGEGEMVYKSAVTFDQKTVTLRKRTAGIDATYEALRYNTVEFVSLFFEDMGRRWAHQLNSDAVTTLLNGDIPSGTDAAAVIGVESTSAGFTYDDDLLRVWLRMTRMGRRPTVVVGNESTVAAFLRLSEIKNRQQGAPLVGVAMRAGVPTSFTVVVSDAAPSDHLGFTDPSVAMVQLTSDPLLIETDRIISKQIVEHVASITTGFAVLQRDGRVWVNAGVAYAGNPFPAWFNTIGL